MKDRVTSKVVQSKQGHERIKSVLKQLLTKALHWQAHMEKIKRRGVSRASNRKCLAGSCFKMQLTRAWGETG